MKRRRSKQELAHTQPKLFSSLGLLTFCSMQAAKLNKGSVMHCNRMGMSSLGAVAQLMQTTRGAASGCG
jgi:hypothetical protein